MTAIDLDSIPQPPAPPRPAVPAVPPLPESPEAPPEPGGRTLFKQGPAGKTLAQRPPRVLDESWYQWIADNLLRDCTIESMLATMVAQGFDRAESDAVIRAIDNSPILRAARKMQQVQRKFESVLANQQKVWQIAPGYAQVERRGDVSRDEFIERYICGSRPVVLTEVARDWPAMRRWSPQDLRTRFGHHTVEIQAERNTDPKFEQNKLQHRRKVLLADFVDQVVAGGATNDYYLTANNEVLRTPEFSPLLDDIGSMPAVCERADLPRAASFWFGPAGTNTPLHHDTLMLFHTQVVGRKRWRFISPLETPRLYNYVGVFSPIDIDHPDLARYPRFREVTILEVVVEPGETVFLPLGWWHQVSSLEISLSFSYTNLTVPNEFTYVNPEIYEW